MINMTQEFLQERLRGVAPDSLLVHAWQEFYEFYNEIIRRFALSSSLPKSEVDDCVQEVWCTVVEELPNFDYDPHRGRFRSWLYALVRNKAMDRVRRRARHPVGSLHDAQATGLRDASDQADPTAALEQRWNQELVRTVLGELQKVSSETSYQVFYLRSIEERSVAEVAQAMDLTPAQVRARHHRLRRRFRTMLDLFAGRDLGGEPHREGP